MRTASPFLRFVSLALVLVLGVAATPCVGATVDDSANSGVQATGSDEEDDYGEEIVFGLFIAIVAVLVWVGFKSDLEWWGAKDEPAAVPLASESKPELFVDLNPIDNYDGPSLEADVEYEFAGRAGVKVRF